MEELRVARIGTKLVAIVVAWALAAAPVAAQPSTVQEAPQGAPPVIVTEPAPGTASGEVYVVPPGSVPPPGTYVAVEQNRYQLLQERLSYLQAERSRYPVGGPIVMMALGGAMFILGGSMAWTLRALDREGVEESGFFDRRRATGIFFGVMGVGGALVIIGTITFVGRKQQRRQFEPEIRQIRQELRQIERSQRMGYGAALELDLGFFGGTGLGAQLRF